LTVDDFLDQNNKEHRHKIFFEDTSEKDGFVGAPGVDKDQIGYLEAWQFQVCDATDWRVHGFILDETFYIVWLDPLHRLYPRPATGTAGERRFASGTIED
jgi:hypothetical protein